MTHMPSLHGEYNSSEDSFYCGTCGIWFSREYVTKPGHEHFTKDTIYFCETPLKYKPYGKLDSEVKTRKILTDTREPEIVTSKSGAKRTAVKNRFDLVPPTFLTRVAARFAIGTKHYTDYNWRDGVEDEEFVQSRINHMMIHWQDFLQNKNTKDDNLAAVAWCIAMLMEFQEHSLGKQTIERVLRTMNFTPSIEKSECICGYDARNNERDVNLDCPVHMPSSVKENRKDETF